MKKVWILEKYVTVEEMYKSLEQSNELYASVKESGTKEQIAMVEEMIQKQNDKMEQNPNGYWSGWEGKSIYRQFCDVAKAAIRRADKGTQFRVVEGEVQDDAKFWTGYKFVKENEGVFRYLMATCNK